MKEWTQEKLEETGYMIENAQISRVDLSMADYGVLTLEMPIIGNGWGCVCGGRVIGKGYLGAKEFKGSPMGSDGIDYAVAFWRSDADAWDDPLHGWLDSFEFNVKAWMPLPEPYREKGEKHEGSD